MTKLVITGGKVLVPKDGDLKIWWIPQVPGEAFETGVASLAMARKLLWVLADYDLFQLEHNIKPDYSNAGGLMVYDHKAVQEEASDVGVTADGWIDFYTDAGLDIDALSDAEIEVLDAARSMAPVEVQPAGWGWCPNTSLRIPKGECGCCCDECGSSLGASGIGGGSWVCMTHGVKG